MRKQLLGALVVSPVEAAPALEATATPGHWLYDVRLDDQSLIVALHRFGLVLLGHAGTCIKRHTAEARRQL